MSACDMRDATGRHAWVPGGLDIVRGALRYVDTCTACPARRTRPYPRRAAGRR